MMKWRNYGKVSVVLIGLVSTNLYAQESCLEEGQVDINNDGYFDEYVSPGALIVNSEISCGPHSIAAGLT